MCKISNLKLHGKCLPKSCTLYKGNFKKYKGKLWKSVFWNFKLLNIFKSCLRRGVKIENRENLGQFPNRGVKRSVRASGMQIKAIKRLWNMFYKSKFQNTDFQNFPLYFLKFPLYNVRGLRGHFPLEFRAHLYVFGISGGRRMGKHTELNLIPTFNFFGTP